MSDQQHRARVRSWQRGVTPPAPVSAGNPHLDFLNAMEAEHCRLDGALAEFHTHSHRSTTTPRNEWDLVRGRAACTPEELRGGRRIPDIEGLMALETAREAKLREAEVVAVVLYTGPMVLALRAPAAERSEEEQ